MLHTLPFRGEAAPLVQPVDRPVQPLMGDAQVGRHEVGVVEIGERGVGPSRAGVKDGLRQRFQNGRVLATQEAGGEREGVVDDADGVAVVALQSAAELAEPGHVHR